MDMDTIKNFIYAGVGLAATTTERVKETINDLVEKGKISDTEGKKLMDEFFKSTEQTKEEFEAKWKKINESLSSKIKLPSTSNNEEVESLKKRIEELESELAKAKKSSTTKKATTRKTTAKKTVAKKTTTAKKAPAKSTAKKVTTK